ncbi:hypothetical protein CCY99_07655 [Helicobacter sp. 16-1353]|uniref:hypothetical protein n=1 Tax=Helicobacter sp. 16-1353 TaxID=2004996 RepID=UPI000DCCD7F8|nr:hypothetical protein [Helicobacter sp. 16-1353]RAX52258.1 hypothetical protein CCY99_07655 [Helicobacter sp. 16-1353]
MKKIKLGSTLCVSIFAASSLVNLSAADITIDSYGYLGAMYNHEFQGNKDSTIGLTARAGATFSFENGLAFGLGAAGAWAAYDKNSGNLAGVNSGVNNAFLSSQYPNTGDVSEAFIKYTSQQWELAVGRYVADFLDFDWLAGHTQGIGFKYNDLGLKNLDLWLTYFNSVMITGYQPGRIASELGTFYSYHPGGRNAIIGQHGGNIIAGGVNLQLGKFTIDPFLLINTSLAGTDDMLFQVGLKFGFATPIAKDWLSTTLVRAMFQYANQQVATTTQPAKINTMFLTGDVRNPDDVGFLIWADQEFKYQNWVKFGVGLYFVGGQGIYHINDNSRFYGSWVNAFGYNYFGQDMFSAYAFGSFELIDNKLSIDALFAGGDFTEFSAVVKYRVWQQSSMKADIGAGYVHNEFKEGGISQYKGGHFLLFAKLSY